MSRAAILIIILLAIVGGLVFLSTTAKEQPVRTIEAPVPQGGNAR